MKKYSDKIICALATSCIGMTWMALSSWLGVPGWAGFAGCTAYFAAPGKGVKSIPATLACVSSGIVYALLSIYIGQAGSTVSLCMTFVTTFFMCMGGSFSRLLEFVPGAFIGSFSTFAAGGDMISLVTILSGVFLGLLCDCSGIFLCELKKRKFDSEQA